MVCRNVIALLLATGLLAGCDNFKRGNYELQKQLGMYPVDPPRAETAPPPPGTVSQANWAAQRAATYEVRNQGNTAPVNYRDPEELAAEADRAAAAKAPSPGSKPPVPAQRTAAMRTAPAAAATAPSAVSAAAPTVVASAAGLPAGYTPSPAAVDDPVKAQEAQKMAAATGAAPTPPEMAGSMKGMSTAATGWRAHLASHRTESAAINEWQELLRANPSLYGQYDPLVEWVDTPSRGAFARLVLVGFAERKDADAACAKIRSSTRYCSSVKE